MQRYTGWVITIVKCKANNRCAPDQLHFVNKLTKHYNDFSHQTHRKRLITLKHELGGRAKILATVGNCQQACINHTFVSNPQTLLRDELGKYYR